MPREEAEFALSYYNSLTTWIDIDRLLAGFELTRDDLANEEKVSAAIRHSGAHADVCDAQGCQEALGPRAGGRFSGDAVRKALG